MNRPVPRAVRWVVAMNVVVIITLWGCASSVAQAVKPGSWVLWVPLPVLLILLLGLYGWRRVPVLSPPRLLVAVLWAVPFVLWWQYVLGPDVRQATHRGVPVMVIFTFGFYVMALSTQLVLAHTRGGRMDLSMVCSVMGMGMAGVVSSEWVSWAMPFYLGALVVFIPLMVWTMRAHQMEGEPSSARHVWRWVLPMLLLAAGTLIGRMGLVMASEKSNEILHDYAHHLVERRAFVDFQGQVRHIGSIETLLGHDQPEGVMLRVFGKKPGVYLRGAVFDEYRPGGAEYRVRGRWSVASLPKHPTREVELRSTAEHLGRNIFNLHTQRAEEPLAAVYPIKALSSAYFVPMGTHQVASYATRVRCWPRFESMWPARPAEGGYLYFNAIRKPPVPHDFDRRIPRRIKMALEVFVQRRILPEGRTLSTSEKIDRVVAYFKKNYQYQIGQTFSGRQDPVVEFLYEKEHGHCEYFASAAALLLRTMGVPTRYATGFVCRERGVGEDLWLVRRRDAHAWVEAFVAEENRWVVVEATPPGFEPPPVTSSQIEQWRQGLAAWWARLSGVVIHGGFDAVLANLWALGRQWFAFVSAWLWGGVVLAGLVWFFRDKWRRLFGRKRRQPVRPHVEVLRQKLKQAEQRLASYGLVLQEAQTVGQWQQVVEATSLPESVRAEVDALLGEYQTMRFQEVAASKASAGKIH